MDGWLPTPEEVSCDAAKEIPVYQALNTPQGMTLKQITKPETECFNPPRLSCAIDEESGGCLPGSKLGQMQRGNVWAKWICRREHVSDKLFDPRHNYEDHGMILFNQSTGATCHFDDSNNITNGNNNPDVDLTGGEQAKVAAFLKTYSQQEGENCITCHDNDPFMYSPYLKGVGWQTSDAFTSGKYFAVHTVAEEKSHVVSLTAEKAGPCLACHRIGNKRTCGDFAADAAGLTDHSGLHKWMTARAPNMGDGNALENAPPWGIATGPNGEKWPFPAWMPPDVGPEEATAATWQKDYGEAVQTIRTCCEKPDAPGCTWEKL